MSEMTYPPGMNLLDPASREAIANYRALRASHERLRKALEGIWGFIDDVDMTITREEMKRVELEARSAIEAARKVEER